MRAMNRRRRVRSKETGSFWLSFSDMMSVLVLVFIFVIFSMMLSLAEQTERLKKTEEQYTQAMIRMKQSEKELGEKEQLLIIQSEKLDELTKEMDAQSALLEQKEKELEKTLNENQLIIINLRSQLSDEIAENENLSQRIMMLESNKDAQKEEIDALIIAIEKQKKELDQLGIDYSRLLSAANTTEEQLKNTESQLKNTENQLKNAQSQLATAENVLSSQNKQLSEYESELKRQQTMIEQMIGVKAQIIEALSKELERNNVAVTVDAQTGAITLPSEMLFAVGANTLSDRGMLYLDRFLPVYLSVLLSDDFSQYIAEIIIEGHTDSSGKAGYDPYLYNMQLSQQRALSVTNYILRLDYMANVLGLEVYEQEMLRTLVTSSGRSFSALILNADGTENKTASRRVEIKFRLKDDQTIGATEALLRGLN